LIISVSVAASMMPGFADSSKGFRGRVMAESGSRFDDVWHRVEILHRARQRGDDRWEELVSYLKRLVQIPTSKGLRDGDRTTSRRTAP